MLFDLNRMANGKTSTLKKIMEAQTVNGGWPWFKGMPENAYITQHIAAGFGHLSSLGVLNPEQEPEIKRMLQNAIRFMDEKMAGEYHVLKTKLDPQQLQKDHLSYQDIHYLYTRSFFQDIPLEKKDREAFEFYRDQARKYWLNKNFYMQGMIALSLHRDGDPEVPAAIVKSLKEFALQDEELGMYWESGTGYFWYQSGIEQQALLIEVFEEIAKDEESVNEMKIWLLKQKQVQHWETTKATVKAIYALLLKGNNWLMEDQPVKIKIGDKTIEPGKMDDVKVEAGMGYFKKSWGKGEIDPSMGTVTLTKPGEGIAWGGLYYQYFEDLDKITPGETPLKLTKQLFLQENGSRGPVLKPIDQQQVKVGDRIIVRIVLKVDRLMEYVHMKDGRGSGLEPVNVISGHKYQDGLYYYESTRDASTDFFMDYLPKGTYVFEYPLNVTHQGDFSNGITTIQCMYAPEFSSHSEGIRVQVK